MNLIWFMITEGHGLTMKIETQQMSYKRKN